MTFRAPPSVTLFAETLHLTTQGNTNKDRLPIYSGKNLQLLCYHEPISKRWVVRGIFQQVPLYSSSVRMHFECTGKGNTLAKAIQNLEDTLTRIVDAIASMGG